MNDLRKAAEALIEHWEAGEFKNCTGYMAGHVATLRQALAHEALDRMVAENERLGLYDEDNLQAAIEKGTKAWADVPDATEWVEELRGNDTSEVTPEVPCKTHPDAPHGFDRNASHSADRYVCECEGWEPVDKVNMSEERVHKTDKSMHEFVDWEAVASDQAMTIAMMQIENKKEYQYEVVAEHADGTYTTRRIPKREWAGLTADEIWKCNKAETGSAVEFHICSAHQNVMDFAEAIEAKLKDKNSAPYTKLDTTAGVLHKEWVDRLVRIMGTFDLATGHADTMDQALDALEEELRDVLGHLRARREWVGLTDEDINSYALDIGITANKAPPWLVKYARDIERLSKEKNG